MRTRIGAIALAALFPISSFAVDDAIKDQIEARQSIMNIYGFSMGTLGAMAKGKMDYDAKLASAAAGNLHLASQMDGSMMWAPGTDNSVSELKDLTSAKPEGWSQYEKVSKIGDDFDAAAAKLAAEAGNGLDALRASIGGVGKTCKGCHDITKAK